MSACKADLLRAASNFTIAALPSLRVFTLAAYFSTIWCVWPVIEATSAMDSRLFPGQHPGWNDNAGVYRHSSLALW